MWALASASGELQHLDPAAGALAEYMWLSGVEEPVWIAGIQDVFNRSIDLGAPWPSGALAFWWWKLGRVQEVPERVSAFYRSIIDGEWRTAADFWESRGAPYDQALALMHGDDAAATRALRIFEDLGADAAAARLRRSLLDRGVSVSRGSARSTRRHAAGLTARQAEVLDLLAEGLSNVEIADRLFVSYRTVENHVAAILMKLDVPSREAAVETARERDILG
jgi:DNA-binding CsgD family transcriptional regulator